MKKVNVTKMLFVLMACFFGISQAEVVEWYQQNESGPSWQCESFPNDGDDSACELECQNAGAEYVMSDLVPANVGDGIADDFGGTPSVMDCYDPNSWVNDALFTHEVKSYLKEILNLGFVDCFRAIKPNSKEYSFWDYQHGAWQKDIGIRIDLLLLSPETMDLINDCGISKNLRGYQKPSDHTPVWVTLTNKK